ncbi:hypothetical protein ACOSOMT5_P1397 [Acidiphilium sp. MT5]
MDASARIRRILWGTLRGTVPAPRALDMMVRWEANFAPDFERDPARSVTSFLLQELGGNLNRADCSALADRILAIMDDFSGPLPQDPIASIRRLSEARLSAQPAPAPAPAPAATPPAAKPVAMPVEVPPVEAALVEAASEAVKAPETVHTPEAEALAVAEPVHHALLEPELHDPSPAVEALSAEPVLAEPVMAEPVFEEPVLAEPVWAETVMPVEPEQRADEVMDRAPAGDAAILLDADHAEAEPDGFAGPGRRADHGHVIDHDMFDDRDPVTMTPKAIITAPNGRVLASDDGVDAEYYEMALRVPRGFESARTLEILPPTDEQDGRADHGAELAADWDADWNSDPAWNPDPKAEPNPGVSERPADDTEIPPPPPRSPTADPSAPYGIDRSVFSKIFLEHD